MAKAPQEWVCDVCGKLRIHEVPTEDRSRYGESESNYVTLEFCHGDKRVRTWRRPHRCEKSRSNDYVLSDQQRDEIEKHREEVMWTVELPEFWFNALIHNHDGLKTANKEVTAENENLKAELKAANAKVAAITDQLQRLVDQFGPKAP